MTENSPIIISGVDVSKCENYSPKCRFTCFPHICNCHQKPNCYFKQLARKIQECEELKEQYCNGLDEYKICRTLQDVSYYRDRAEQKLNRIEDYCKEQNLKADYTACVVLNIIDEVKDE